MPETLSSVATVNLHRVNSDSRVAANDVVAVEEPLEIRVRGRAISVTMRTPGHDAELAAGFLLSEGVIRDHCEIDAIEPCDRDDAGSILNVRLAPEVTVAFDQLTRHVFASSSCGVCGKATLESLQKTFAPIQSSMTVSADVILRLPDAMRSAQAAFDQTGGLHAAALFDAAGHLLALREDVGRHNAVDKVIGHALLNDLPVDRSILLVSGRTSFEIVQKALAAGIAIVAAVSAPSSLACELATANGLTLIGFLRGSRMNIYSNSQRVITAAPHAVTA